MDEKLLRYFNGDDFAAGVWKKKYAQEGETTPDDMHMRMAKQFARIEAKYAESPIGNFANAKLSSYGQSRKQLDANKIYNLFKDFKYIIPQGSIMSQLGSKSIGSLSNCFVIGQPEDSYGGIFQKDQEQAQLMKRRGGVGQDISTLRPAKVATSNAAKSSTGPVSFMHRFSNTTREVAQDGRRGALMLSMHINHPDVLEFIKVKRNDTEVTGANISIKLTDEFMEAVDNDDRFVLRWPIDFYEKNPSFKVSLETNKHSAELNKLYPVISQEETLGYTKVIKAKEYWNELIESAHGYAEPGLMFESNHHNYSPDGVYPQFKGVTTNPCGEIFMQPYDACRLIAVNFFSFVLDPFTPEASFDWEKFYQVNYEAMRLSDDLIDLEMEHISRIIRKIDSDPESFDVKRTEKELWEKVYKTAKASRRTGLGFTALGDTLAALGVGYDSDEGMVFIKAIMQTKLRSEFDCSIDMAIIRGPFEGWDPKLEMQTKMDSRGVPVYGKNDFYDMLLEEFPTLAKRMYEHGRRNVSLSTIAPTGSLSIIAKAIKYSNLSSGMEPTFMPYYMRRKKINPNDEGVRVDFTDVNGDTWQEYPIVMGAFKDWLEMIQSIPVEDLSSEQMQGLFEQSPWFGSTANDIDWTKRVEVQALLQKYITHSISSTVNLPKDVAKSEVGKIYMEAWKQGLKGITVYRDGSRSGVLVKNDNTFEQKDAIKRPKELKAETHTTICRGEQYTIIVGLLEGKPYEVFVDNSVNKYATEGRIFKQARGKYIFKNGGPPIDILNFMNAEEEAITRLVSASLRHGADIKFIVEQLQKTGGDMFSFTKGVARVLKKYIPDGALSTVHCLECGSENVIFQEGCQMCKDCGSSKCG
jgi:ribonucleoside-diphosphate reductase alpha chain